MEKAMHSNGRKMLFLPVILAVAAIGASSPALAGGNHDRVYADSFGNLVVETAAGYKRIVVGQGHMARELSSYTQAGRPKVVHVEGPGGVFAYERGCFRPPVLVKGRSYMYGFDQGEIPLQGGPCR
jgi:hypothetical protein